MLLRTCVVESPSILTVGEGGKRLAGAFAPAAQLMLDCFARGFANVTLQASHRLGDRQALEGSEHSDDPEEIRYDGCLGRLQDNSSDTFLPVIDFPILGKNLRHSPATLPVRVMIATAYNVSQVQDKTDVMDAFLAFSLKSRVLILASLVIVTLLLSFMMRFTALFRSTGNPHLLRWTRASRRRLLRLIRRTAEMVIGMLVKQHSSYHVKTRRHGIRLMVAVTATLAFMIGTFFSCTIKTEMVVVKPPDTITSYRDILDRPKVHPFWIRQLRDHEEFQSAASDSLEGRIWTRAMERGMNASRIGADSSLMSQADRVIRHEAVWLGVSYLLVPVMRIFCGLLSESDMVTGDACVCDHDHRSCRSPA